MNFPTTFMTASPYTLSWDSSMFDGLVDNVTSLIPILLPIGIGIMGILLTIKFIPTIIANITGKR